MAGTTPKARALGAELRRAREESGLGLRQLAAKLGTSHATVSRWENGARSPKPEDVAAYLAKVDASAELRAELVELARDPDGSHWLSVGMPDQHRQLAALLEIEREATKITTVSPLLVPGLLQTADYARAIMTVGEVPNDEIDMRVAVRLGRRDAILRKDAAELRAFIGEPVLYQLIGGSSVMADQLRALLKCSEMPNVELRVIPMRSEWHPGLEGPFSLDEFEDRGPVVQLENRVSALFLHEPDEVGAYVHAVDKIAAVAMSQAESVELIGDAIGRTEKAR
ncbi:helix-turn-helix transcriptional regulator [Saccharopolyspora sp. WRP15-2]|uniref:Helix-turn-helix transcriptional regulator n=1 Tax=Saccharopolyspora oryzae TaxID=2997343 RepID=A0ABT4V160_9PSEU|nr:helix-turn-helix transcriptional regulator [Saccharopolyspora oryzae]MDA3627558.1 helix-turn-helix transcriptional regulator [Saccharopolyspora oryzae]